MRLFVSLCIAFLAPCLSAVVDEDSVLLQTRPVADEGGEDRDADGEHQPRPSRRGRLGLVMGSEGEGDAEGKKAKSAREALSVKDEANSATAVQDTLQGVLEQTVDTKNTFNSIAERVGSNAKQLSEQFAHGRSELSQLQEEKEYIEQSMKQDKDLLLKELEDFKSRTLQKLSELQSSDQHLETENQKLTQDNAKLDTDLASEQNMKKLLMSRLSKMAALLRKQSGAVKDMVSRHENRLESQVASDVQDILNAVGDSTDKDGKVDPVALLQKTFPSETETTTLVLR